MGEQYPRTDRVTVNLIRSILSTSGRYQKKPCRQRLKIMPKTFMPDCRQFGILLCSSKAFFFASSLTASIFPDFSDVSKEKIDKGDISYEFTKLR